MDDVFIILHDNPDECEDCIPLLLAGPGRAADKAREEFENESDAEWDLRSSVTSETLDREQVAMMRFGDAIHKIEKLTDDLMEAVVSFQTAMHIALSVYCVTRPREALMEQETANGTD